MKKIVSILLAAITLFSLTACAEPEFKTEEEKGEDISRLSAKELYALGCEKNEGFVSGEFETVVTDGKGESFTVNTVRIREGYDGFRYSRVSENEKLYFYENTAYLKNADGAFSAPSTARVFREYMEEYFFPIGSFGEENLSKADKKELVLSYEIQKEDILSSFASFQTGFVPSALTGECTLDEEGVIKEESFVVEGKTGDEKESFTVKTTLKRYRDGDIEIQKPENVEGYIPLGDIRLPDMITSAVSALQKKSDVQATFVSSNSLLAGEDSYGFHEEITAYQTVGEDKLPLAYQTRQSLKTVPKKDLESLFYQKHIAGGVQKENRYDVVTANLLEENETSEISLPWPDALAEFLPSVSDLKSIKMTEDSVGYSVTFTLKDEAKEKWMEKRLAAFPEAGITAEKNVSFVDLEGTFLISRDLCLTALSYSVEGSFTGSNGNGASFEGQYSMNIDALSEISVPSMQVPTPTTPDMAPEGEVTC